MTDQADEAISHATLVAMQYNAAVSEMQVRTDADLTAANDLLVSVNREIDKVEAIRVSIVKPLNDHVRVLNERFRAITEPMRKLDAMLRDKILQYKKAQAAIAAAENAKLQAAAEKAQARVDRKAERLGIESPRIQAPIVPVAPKTIDGVTTRKTWAFDVTDVHLVPREYLVIDKPKIREAIRNGARQIPGVRIYEAESLAVRK